MITSGKCDFCKNQFHLPCKDARSGASAIKSAGWTTAIVKGELTIACPLEECQESLEDTVSGMSQMKLDLNKTIDEDGEVHNIKEAVNAEC